MGKQDPGKVHPWQFLSKARSPRSPTSGSLWNWKTNWKACCTSQNLLTTKLNIQKLWSTLVKNWKCESFESIRPIARSGSVVAQTKKSVLKRPPKRMEPPHLLVAIPTVAHVKSSKVAWEPVPALCLAWEPTRAARQLRKLQNLHPRNLQSRRPRILQKPVADDAADSDPAEESE